MERRAFLQLSALAPFITHHLEHLSADQGGKGFVVKSGQDRYQEELHVMGGQFDCKLSSKDTDGALLMYDTLRNEKGGPPFHLHHSQDELFYVISGEFIIKVGDDIFNLKSGDFAFAPRKIPHAFAKVSDGEARMLVLFQPAGSMEDFFHEMSKLGTEIPKDQEKRLKELWKSHGIEIVGPPLKF